MSLPLLPSQIRNFRRALLRWYGLHRRALPWRATSDPYRVWVSEIMLQQTRVAAVLEHYRRVLARFPTVERLAVARPAQVLAAWSGLGYYRRARMLHAAARELVRRHGGRLPDTAAGLQALPGIGRYTAAAIASIAFGEPAALVDGNVDRVLTRVLGCPPKDPWAAAQQLLSPSRPGDFNQALMELGATVCLPGQPECHRCPIRRLCATRGRGAPTPAAPRIRRVQSYLLALRDGQVLLRRRSADASLMPGMWELPERNGSRGRPLFVLRHSITNSDYRVTVVRGRAGSGRWVPLGRLSRIPLTGLARKILRRASVIQ